MKPARKLLNWYDKHGRDLPWRKTRDPYKILVSEIMLQQTQVSRGLLFYDRWLAQFPDWSALAAASNAEVIEAWAGLGYNRRALMLRDIARQVIELGEPASKDDWIKLKGIGPYTSAALAAFAHQQRAIPIDTNIRRVLSRLLLGIPYPDLKDDERIREAADTFLPRRGRHYDIPQAIFDLATTVCTKTPDCASCPLRNDCKNADDFLNGRVEAPKAMIKKARERRHRNKPHPDRIFRGRILRLIRESGPTPIAHIGPRIDPTFDADLDGGWLGAMLDRLEKDGMVEIYDKTARLSTR